MLRGTFPSVDQYGNELKGARALKAGKEIAGGWRAAFESWTGDWKERALSHSFVKRNYQSMRLCDQCDAIKPFAKTPPNLMHLIFSDFSEGAAWTQTLRDHTTYLQQTPCAEVTPWVAVPGFTIDRVKFEVAHTVLLGTGKDIAASFLVDLEPYLTVAVFSSRSVIASRKFSFRK